MMQKCLKLIFIGIISWTLIGCGEREDAFDADLLDVSQSADFQLITYTVRIKGSGLCDLMGTEVKILMPIAADSADSPGLDMQETHEMGRVQRDKNKKVTFEIATFGRKIDIDAMEIEQVSGTKYDNCRYFRV